MRGESGSTVKETSSLEVPKQASPPSRLPDSRNCAESASSSLLPLGRARAVPVAQQQLAEGVHADESNCHVPRNGDSSDADDEDEAGEAAEADPVTEAEVELLELELAPVCDDVLTEPVAAEGCAEEDMPEPAAAGEEDEEECVGTSSGVLEAESVGSAAVPAVG